MPDSKEFKVDPDALDAVVSKIKDLLDDVSGGGAALPGSLPDFEQNAGDLATPLATFWGDVHNVLADAYTYVHKGVSKTYQDMQAQLNILITAATQTATTYRTQEEQNEALMKLKNGGL